MDNDGPNASTRTDEPTGGGPDTSLACNCCRKRKLRCSREAPTCENCRKTGYECVYESKRSKPGMKTGAIENLHRRLDVLERSVSRQQEALNNLQSEANSGGDTSSHQGQTATGHSILLSLAQEICKLSGQSPKSSSVPEGSDVSRKRRRISSDVGHQHVDRHNAPSLPDNSVLEQIISAYFTHIHPWIPMIHEARFRRRIQDDTGKDTLHLVLQAMVLVASRYVSSKVIADRAMTFAGDQEDFRDWIVAKATKSMSVENLQALIIICFNDIGNGEASQAWSLVGALTRIVEYLQLTIEDDEVDRSSFSQPYISLSSPQGWTEAEERRRVFWCVFNLDRFCSVTTGWNTSLTSDDVNRRLPCDGITWRKEDPVSTPYFGIWDKSAARIGNPIAFLPAHPILSQAGADDEGRTPSEAGTSPGAASAVDMSTVGAFAYCIEATESLSRVTSYFLQQRVNTKDQKDLSSWLTRFKELDVRLVHWKMLLPRKWKVNITQQSSRMDPNLTLAHVTHNASMILLHQPIAFPPLNWPFRTRLPSLCSVDTCQAAAVEIATITDHYLNNLAEMGPLNNQFAFCVYIAARVLLLYWRYSSIDCLSPEFWLLIQSLEAMSKRWAGLVGPQDNLASKYSATLIQLHAQCTQDESFAISIPAYTTEVKHSKVPLQTPSGGLDRRQWLRNEAPNVPSPQLRTTYSATELVSQYTPVNISSNAISLGHSTEPYSGGSGSGGELGMISQMLFDAQFADMDRVISFDDGMFEGGGDM
ncbi:fungal-specific transcription factor domain-containing protein [Fusarium solani]|uniref:Fungal-specific transcription factor domain-containing protein n=1 Tax=Fusarium solani TaxID=169388 RepID=A0A9P9H478_FUSSL|nr:fungal-specific transcription factor domain-containing protein [Fusarium solani]KAH7250833.1 fungal-specific transcription factor domain-containing protein [Fusarium solani]